MNPDQIDHQDCNTGDEARASTKARHDIRASLAITRGFSKALESSFSDLCQTVEHALAGCDSGTNSEAVTRIAELEADCGFCLSRIERSLEQLSERIEARATFVGNADQTGRSTL